MDLSSEGLAMGSHSVHLREESASGLAQDRGLVTIDELPESLLFSLVCQASFSFDIPLTPLIPLIL